MISSSLNRSAFFNGRETKNAPVCFYTPKRRFGLKFLSVCFKKNSKKYSSQNLSRLNKLFKRFSDETTNNKIGKMSENVHLNSQFTNSSGISNKNDGDVVIQDDLTEMLSIVPEDVREKISKHAHRSKLLEIVLDLGRQPEARFSGMEDV